MTHAEIECFLAIYRHKTVSAAAQALYITQPSLSARLKALERQVGTQLFYRCKGSREMVPTQSGQEFYQLAVQYTKLIKRMQNLGNAKKNTLRVSCFNSLGTYLFPAVYKLFLQTNSQISLQTQDMQLTAACQSLLLDETDLVFTIGRVSDSQLRQVPIFSEPMVLICAADFQLQAPVSLSELSPQDEIFVRWSGAYARWHKKVFGNFQPQICVSIMAQLRQFLEEGDRWAIAPISVVKGLESECNIRQIETDVTMPRRQVSYVVRAERSVPALDAFLDCLRQVLTTCPEIEILL